MKKIAHICPDEKFIDYAVKNFEAVENNISNFYIVSRGPLKHVKADGVKRLSILKFLIFCILGKYNEYDLVIIHSLRKVNKLQLLLSSKKTKFLWVGFGYDYYNLYRSRKYLPITNQLVNLQKEHKSIFQNSLLSKRIFSKINFFAPVFDIEYEHAKGNIPGLNARFIDWNYGSSNTTISKFKDTKVSGNKVLIGNSCAPTNNHLDVLEIIKDSILEYEIILPLSYGDLIYKNKLMEKLKLNYNCYNFECIEEFLPVDSYFDKLKECSLAVFGYTTQAAVGNIVVMLYLGAKVFLHEDNYLLTYFRNRGFIIFSINDFDFECKKVLLEDDIVKNKMLVDEMTNFDLIKEKTRKLIRTCAY
ncbi:TDP-N-acetylfucosamine:lipid II N-acetylfucosaminyltransferase [Vibrio diabolicus]|uniref:TDP-N-acetylfucosamine:lipid II N-acetylfucosaminyltransferase n=1 Tax=Vibrio diabolicus TaxID=50719 RepID=UPI00211AAADD|nr:TDP-N-acetylfucosamine:lipid II N-acetylfucosaminyltransferase [Vibrio diabolicus]MCG6223061.1 TDP-N-acetylfucosamine:lipid II N-acetylfucosaminyltransferase [Vibrio diabolicus]